MGIFLVNCRKFISERVEKIEEQTKEKGKAGGSKTRKAKTGRAEKGTK